MNKYPAGFQEFLRGLGDLGTVVPVNFTSTREEPEEPEEEDEDVEENARKRRSGTTGESE